MKRCIREKGFCENLSAALAAVGAAAIRTVVLMVLALTVMNPAACELDEKKDAPGCASGFRCGGCTGKKAIRDFVYEGPDCFHAGVNDCTSILLEVSNHCESEAQLGGQTIPADGIYHGFNVVKLPDGTFALEPSYGSSEPSIPPNDETVSLTGTVGTETLTITMFVTGEQC